MCKFLTPGLPFSFIVHCSYTFSKDLFLLLLVVFEMGMKEGECLSMLPRLISNPGIQ